MVIKYGAGGRMDMHYQLYTDYRRAKTKVEVRGPCYSACTLVLAYVEDNLRSRKARFMAFHAVRSKETGATHGLGNQDCLHEHAASDPKAGSMTTAVAENLPLARLLDAARSRAVGDGLPEM